MNRPSYGCVRFGQKDKTPKIRATQAWRTDLSVVRALYTQTTQRAAEYHVIPANVRGCHTLAPSLITQCSLILGTIYYTRMHNMLEMSQINNHREWGAFSLVVKPCQFVS